MLEVNEAEDMVQLMTFKEGLRSKEFLVALTKSPPSSMIDSLIKAQKFMNVEDALAAIEVGEPWTSKASAQDNLKGKREKGKITHPTMTGTSKGMTRLEKW